MDDENGLLRRRLDRERLARKAAERITEERSRELYFQGQELERAAAAERQARGEAETLRDALEAFTARLDPDEVVRRLQDFLARLVPHSASAVYLLEAGSAPADLPESLGAIREASRPIVITSGSPGTGMPVDGVTWLAAPLLAHGDYIGFVLLGSNDAGAFDDAHARLAQALTGEAAVALQNAHLFREVERLSAIDPLTGLHNRRHFEAAARAEFARAKRYALKLSAVMLDLDHFKNVNDTYGHGAGDDVLEQVAGACLRQLRESDLHARYGGEELCFLLPQTGRDEAVAMAERVRAAIAELRFDAGATSFSVTASLGVAERDGDGDSLESLLLRSDKALYKAKRGGRDRVVAG
jgi:diguanylate cyclase (GGDEF)-like protein